MDWSTALATVKGDRQLLESLIEAFLDEAPRLMETIRRAIGQTDAEALRVAAHTLKGSMRYFGAQPSFDNTERLEKMGREGNLEGAGPALEALEGDMAKLMPVLIDYVR